MKESVICAVQHSGKGVFRSALCGAKSTANSALSLHCVPFCYSLRDTLCQLQAMGTERMAQGYPKLTLMIK